MKPKIVTIRGERQIKLIARILSNVEQDGNTQVVIGPVSKDRSANQLRLYWKWMGEIAEYTGETPPEVHEGLKRKFLIHQMARDSESYMRLLMMVADHGEERDRVELVRMTSTKGLKVKQMGEYMQNVRKEAASMGIHLTEAI